VQIFTRTFQQQKGVEMNRSPEDTGRFLGAVKHILYIHHEDLGRLPSGIPRDQTTRSMYSAVLEAIRQGTPFLYVEGDEIESRSYARLTSGQQCAQQLTSFKHKIHVGDGESVQLRLLRLLRDDKALRSLFAGFETSEQRIKLFLEEPLPVTWNQIKEIWSEITQDLRREHSHDMTPKLLKEAEWVFVRKLHRMLPPIPMPSDPGLLNPDSDD